MIDIRILRNEPEKVKENCRIRGCGIDIEKLYEQYREYAALKSEIENMRAERNRLSKQCKEKPEAREQVRSIKQELGEKQKRFEELEKEINDKLVWLPNFLAPDVPPGESDEDNVEVRQCGGYPQFDFTPRSHDELGQKLGIIDTERGAKVAQSGFYYWKGKGAQLASALFFWAQQELIKRGFTLFFTPCAAKQHTLYGTGYLPFTADEAYQIKDQDLSLIGTSEQTLVGYHSNEILENDQLPRCYAAYTPCFRTEAGGYGKTTRGIFRVHQFHKVEQIIFCKPEDSPRFHQACQETEEEMMQELDIPYRVVNVCVGDLGAPGYKKFDIEAWYPGYGDYREVTSNTNLTDFQARRLKIRYKNANGENQLVHTISATAVTDRVACAIMENSQKEDGTVVIPEVLRPYTGFSEIAPED